jgi:hypothetical protein
MLLRCLGQATALELYNVSVPLAWVAHGFTDCTLNSGILGDLEWSLCVTCGAWLASYLFDHVVYTEYDPAFAQQHVLPVLQGAVSFFMEHVFIQDGTAHTGPTSSPENSYRWHIDAKGHLAGMTSHWLYACLNTPDAADAWGRSQTRHATVLSAAADCVPSLHSGN